MKIFVARLAFRTRAEDLRAYFEQFGQVDECNLIMDHETGRSKCYAFIEMPNEAEAYKAIVETDDMDFQGSVLQVKKSRPQPENSNFSRPKQQNARPRFNKRNDTEQS